VIRECRNSNIDLATVVRTNKQIVTKLLTRGIDREISCRLTPRIAAAILVGSVMGQ
jgi:hypothetical protein